MKAVIVGAGVIGALIAWRLACAGARVTLIDAGLPAGAASGASFGWINASFHADADHFRLRHAAMAAHRRAQADLGTDAIRWPGCLCWEVQGAAQDAQLRSLLELGYDARQIGRAEFARMEPAVAQPPDQALVFGGEGVVDLGHLTRDALAAAADRGARLITGVAVTGLIDAQGAVRGVVTAQGRIAADRVVIAGGTGTTALLDTVGVALPMLRRPGLLLRSRPVATKIRHVLVSPAQELRQDDAGRIIAPTAAAHQGDTAEQVTDSPDVLADRAMARIRSLLGLPEPGWAEVTLALRPVPGDGLPVVGGCGPAGLFVSTMHSGATLAPLVAEISASEVMDRAPSNAQTALIAPYRPARFQSVSS